MKTFDYYCFVECDEIFRMNPIFKKQIELGTKIANILDLETKTKNTAKIVKYFLLLFKNIMLKKLDFNTPEEFTKYCKDIQQFIEKNSEIIDYFDGLYSTDKYTFLGMYKREIEEAIKRNKFLVYDKKEESFFDIYGYKVNITGKNIFLRTVDVSAKEKIEQIGAIGINTTSEETMLENWFLYIKVDRDIHLTTLRKIIENPTFYFENYIINNKVFIKTLKKKFSDVCRIEQTALPPYNIKFIQLNEVDNPFSNIDSIDLDEQIIISKPIKTIKDKHGLREWRAFIIDNEIQSISRRDAKESIKIEDKVLNFAKRKTQENIGKIPANYVMDIMEYIDEFDTLKLDIVEFNPMVNAWSFFDNNIVYGNPNPKSLRIGGLNNEELLQVYSSLQLALRKK